MIASGSIVRLDAGEHEGKLARLQRRHKDGTATVSMLPEGGRKKKSIKFKVPMLAVSLHTDGREINSWRRKHEKADAGGD